MELVERLAAQAVGALPDDLTRSVDRAEHTARHVAVGQRVKVWDRANIGTVTNVDDTAGCVTVQFQASSGRTAERTVPWHLIEIMEPDAPGRVLGDPAQRHLDRLHQYADSAYEDWRTHLANTGVEPGEDALTTRAVEQAIERATERLLARRPDWIDQLLGPEPQDPVASEVWTDAVRALAGHRARNHIDDNTPGLGPPPAEQTDQWLDSSARVVRARQWMANDLRPTDFAPRMRSASELNQRHAELDQLLASAPDDQRHLIDRLRHGPQLTLHETTEHLAAALGQQGDRRDWILEHWPHIVEYEEIGTAVAVPRAGPHEPHVFLRQQLAAPAMEPATDQSLGL